MIELRTVLGPTGRLLATMLRERGLEITTRGQAIVSYGVPVSSNLPTLNRNAGRLNKLQELERLQAAGVLVPPFHRTGEGLTFPVLGRQLKHTQGRDIIPILANDADFPRLRSTSAYFVQYIPRRREYRVWAYRRRPLAVYEKVMEHPSEFNPRQARLGWHRGQGFAFQYCRDATDNLRELGYQAVDALGLDFGAADIIESTDGRLYVLEVNTAPGTEGPRQGITSLANKIARWVRGGYKRRNGDVNPQENSSQ